MYAKCLDDMTKVMTERGVDATVSMLVKVRASFGAPASLVQIVQIEVSDVVLIAAKD